MKRLVSLFLALTLVLTLVPTGVFANDASAFSDVNASDYYAEAAEILAQSGVLKGYPDGTFGAEKSITRAEMAAVVCRVLEKETEAQNVKGETVYDDVSAEHWASGYINLATNEKIIGGDGNGKFRPENEVKYEEAIKMVICALGFADSAVSDPSDWSKVYLDIAAEKGITKNLLGKKGEPAMRGDIAVMTYAGITAKDASEKDEEEIKDSNFNANDKNVASLPSGGRSPSAPSGPAPTPDDGTFSVSFDLNYEGATNAPETQYVNEGEYVTEPDVQDRDGFAFVGWYVDNTYAELFNFATPITKAYTLVARWVDIADTTDTDGDGLTDPIEEYYGTDKTKADTDGDELSDFVEINILSLNALSNDTDEDGTLDGDEDTDGDGIINKTEITNGTDPAFEDTDIDGLTDKEEETYNTNPLNADTDDDGVSDGKEIELGTDPLAAQETFSMNLSAIDTGSGAVASVQMNLPGEQVETLSVEPVNDDTFFPETMPGYMGQAYEFNVDGEFESATISFEFDASLLDEGADPVIYYYNEDEQELEELPTTITGNVASTNVTHFSKYILVDRKVYQESFVWQDVWESDKNYTGVEIVLVIDDSGSMWSNDSNNLRLAVAQNLVDKLPANSKIGIVNFSGYTTILTSELTNDKEAAKGYLTEQYFKSSGGTRMYGAIFESVELYESDDDSIMKVMVVLTDGDTSDTSSHSAAITTMNELGIKVYTVGLGRSTSYFNSYLKPLATNTGAAFYLATDAGQLESIYDNISEKIDIETDTDDDGIPDYYEDNMIVFSGVRLSLDKNNPDTDGDGIKDGDEVIITKETNADGTKVKVTGKLVLGNPTKADTDGDGYKDVEDKEPFQWNVSDRDLAILSQAIYSRSIPVGELFENIEEDVVNEIDENFHGTASIRELQGWQLAYYWRSTQNVEDDKTYGGYCYGLFTNGTNAVLVFRGSVGDRETSIKEKRGDWYRNFFVYPFVNDPDGQNAENIASTIAESGIVANKDFYITGHSRGGMLAQRAGVGLVEENCESKLKELVYFNGMGVVFSTLNEEAREMRDSLKSISKKIVCNCIDGDIVSKLGTHVVNKELYPFMQVAADAHKNTAEHYLCNFTAQLKRGK